MFRARIPHTGDDIKVRIHDKVDGKKVRQEVKASRQWQYRHPYQEKEGIYYPEEEEKSNDGR